MDGSHNLIGYSLAGRYKLLKMIGAGGMGSVYQAADSQMSNRIVAVKVLAPHLVSDDKQVLRFEQEARAANQLRHPNTISVIDFGRDPAGHIFMVIEFLTGETLTNVLRKGPMDPSRAMIMMRQVCKSLAEAHAKGIIHRDLKPDNIFVCEIYGEKDFIKVIDFGIAKFLESGGQELTQAGKMFGTPRYLSPEQAQGLPLTGASDLYALGVILFEMLAGRPPFVAEDPIAVAIKHVQETPPTFDEVAPGVDVPDELDHLVFKLLAKKAANRHQSAEEVVASLDLALAALGNRNPSGNFTPVAARTPARPKTIPPTSRQAEEADATRAIDSLSLPTAQPGDERTMALDSLSMPPPVAAGSHGGGSHGGGSAVAANERTVALDLDAARSAMDAVRADKKPAPHSRAKPANAPAAGSSRNLILLLIFVLLTVAAVVAASMQSGGADSRPVQVAQGVANGAAGPAAAVPEPARPATPEPEPEPPAKVEPIAPKPPAAPVEFKVNVVSTPPGAEVTLDGLVMGKTPFELKLSPERATMTYVLKLDEYEDYKLEAASLLKLAQAGGSQVLPELKAKPKAVVKPVVRKKPKASDWE